MKKLTTKLFYLIIFLAVISSSASCPKDIGQGEISKTDNVGGYKIHATPNNLDIPGSIIAIDKNNVMIKVDNLDVKPDEGSVSIGSKKLERTVEIDFLLNYAGVPKLDLKTDTEYNREKKVKVSFSVDGIAQKSEVPILDIKSKLNEVRKEINDTFTKEEMKNNGFKFYLITETVKATKVKFKFDQTVADDAELNTKFFSVVDSKNNIDWDGEAGYELSFNYDKPLTVLYKVIKILPTGSIQGEENFKFGEEVETSNKALFNSKKDE